MSILLALGLEQAYGLKGVTRLSLLPKKINDLGWLMGAVGWFLQRNDIFYLTGGQGEFQYGLKYADSKSRHIPHAQLKSFIDKTRKQHTIMLFDKSSSLKKPEYVPKPDKTIRENTFVLGIYNQNAGH